MNRFCVGGCVTIGLLLVGCAGQNGSGTSYGGYDSSLNSPGSTLNTSSSGRLSPTPNAAAWPMENGAAVMVRGIAAPSIQIAPPAGSNFNGASTDAVLKDIADLGFTVVRVTAFPANRGLKLGKDGLISGVEDSAMKNLSDLVEHARANKVQLYIDFTDGFKGLDKSPVTDKKAQEAYAKNVVGQIARKLKAKEGVFAFDLDSDLASQVKTEQGKAPDWSAVRTFVKAATDAIKRQDPERLVCAGPVPTEILQGGQLGGLGLDFYSLSAANDKGALPDPAIFKADRPVIVGYATQASTDASDELLSGALKAFIRNSVDAKYSGYVLWSYSTLDEDGARSIVDKSGKHKAAADIVKSTIAETKK